MILKSFMKTKMSVLFVMFFCISSIHAQDKVSVKKGDVKVNDTLIANYDGVGGLINAVRLGFFSVGSKDTIFSVQEDFFDPKNPLYPFYKYTSLIEFKNTSIPPIRILNSNKYDERTLAKSIFNEKNPLMIKNGKLDEAAVENFRKKNSYDLLKLQNEIKEVEDSIKELGKYNVVRDKSKPVELKLISDNSIRQTISQKFDIYQGDVCIGLLVKDGIRSESFPRVTYIVYKKPDHVVTINGMKLNLIPIVFCEAKGSTVENNVKTNVIDIATKNEFSIVGKYYDYMEIVLSNALISKGML